MNKAMHSALALVLASVAGGSGCQGSSTPPPPPPPSMSQTIGATGGTLTAAQLGGAALQIPQGALVQDTKITVSMGASAAQSGQTAVGPSLHFEPAGLAFATPVTLTLPYTLGALPTASELAVVSTVQAQHTALPGGLLNVDSHAGTISVNVSQLTDYQVVATGQVLPPLNNDVDILFMIDNSPSMSPKQLALAANIPKFIQAIEALGVNYHIGVTTSDVGSWKAPGTPWGAPLGTCNSYEGDDGHLQAVPCTGRTYSDPNDPAKVACNTLCPDPRWVPNDGSSFISKTGGQSNIAVPTGGDASAATTNAFKCLALVGDMGCGVEGQLEGAKRALDGHNSGNAGFLRPNSLLTVVFITDEDDCSVQLAQRAKNDPTTTDCETPDKNASFSCFNPDYRCMAMDLECDEPMNQSGLKSGCKERTDTYLESVNQYVSFFAGLRPTNRLYVGGIWTTPAVDHGGKLVVTQSSMTNQSDGLNRDIGANAGCTYTGSDPNSQGVFGRPQLRLSRLARSFNGSMEVSVCDTDHYATVLDNLAAAIAHKIGM